MPKARRVKRRVGAPDRGGLLGGVLPRLGKQLDRRLKAKKLAGGKGPGELVGGLAEALLGSVVLAVAASVPGLGPTEDAIRAAGGDVGEALHGHKCGPECWHAIGETAAAREAWWEEKMKRYDASRKET